MTTFGWIISVAICVILLAVAFLNHLKKPYKVIGIIVALALCVGVYFGGVALFPAENAEEFAVEENIESETLVVGENVESESGNN